MAQFSDLLGKTLTRVEQRDAERLEFYCEDGSKFALHHQQDCCETVQLEEIVGDLADLVGSPILQAEEATNSDNKPGQYAESWTWTFYKLATIKGNVTLRWLGESNGYYSEGVDFDKF